MGSIPLPNILLLYRLNTMELKPTLGVYNEDDTNIRVSSREPNIANILQRTKEEPAGEDGGRGAWCAFVWVRDVDLSLSLSLLVLFFRTSEL